MCAIPLEFAAIPGQDGLRHRVQQLRLPSGRRAPADCGRKVPAGRYCRQGAVFSCARNHGL